MEWTPLEFEPQHHITRDDRAAVDRLSALDRAHGEAREIVVARRIEPRHLRRLAADEGAADLAARPGDAGDDALGLRHFEPAGGEIIEEEERLGALHDEVVDAHGDEIDPDLVVPAGLDRDLELGADAVGRRDQDRILVAGRLQVEERAETAQSCLGPGARRRPRQRLQRLDKRVPGIDIDAGLAVGFGALGVHPSVLRHRSGGEKPSRHR